MLRQGAVAEMCKKVEPDFGLEENGEVTCHVGRCVKASSRWQEEVRPVVW